MYKQGDILVCKEGFELEVIGTSGKALFMKESSAVWDMERLNFNGYKLKQKEWEPTEECEFWYITSQGNVEWDVYDKLSKRQEEVIDFMGAFETKELAQQRLEEIKKLLK